MRLRLLIAEHRDNYFPAWLEAFSGIDSVSVLNERLSSFSEFGGIDAEIMRGIYAHERYGGTPGTGKSQILSTKGDEKMPALVVTTPPFPAHLENVVQPDESSRVAVVRDQLRDPGDEEYLAFDKVFDAVTLFNSEQKDLRINSLVFSPEFLGIPQRDIHSEVAAIRNAYLKHFP